MQYVVPAFSAPVGHLRAKACWVTQQYADVRFAAGRGRGPSFQQLFQKTLGLLADPELPVCAKHLLPITTAPSALVPKSTQCISLGPRPTHGRRSD